MQPSVRLFFPALAVLLTLLLPGSFADRVRAQETLSGEQQVKVVRLYFRDLAERDRLATRYAAEEVPTSGGYLTFIAGPARYAEFTSLGLKLEVDERATRELNEAATYRDADPLTFYGGYKTVSEIYAFLDQQVAAYPGLAEKVDIGDSWCKRFGPCPQPSPGFGGYDLFVLHITNRAIPGPKPVFWLDAGIHSREIATPEVAMRFMSWLLAGYNTDADARWLVDYHDIWVMPVLNPDGYHIVASPGEEFPYTQRKNADSDDGCTTYPPNNASQFGTDLNRNFPFNWACCDGSSADPCSLVYRGPSAESEVETQAVAARLRALIPDQRGPLDTDVAPITTTGIYQNLHTVVPINLYPWGWTSDPPPNLADLRNIAAHMSAPDAGGNGYPYCRPAEEGCLYTVDGDTLDWAYGELGIPAYTTELGGGSFFPQYAQVESIWSENRGMLLYMAKIARAPYLTSRGPDTVLSSSIPITVARSTAAQLSATINSAWTGNAYSQTVGAAEYYIGIPPWAGGTPRLMSASDGSFDSLTEAVTATIATTGLSIGRHIVFVRGRGIASYEGNPGWGPVSALFLDVADPSWTPTPTATPIACTIQFTDVPPDSTFYPYIRCLACRGIVSGYDDGSFRSNGHITRGQLAKIVSNSAGFSDAPGEQIFLDAPPSDTFYAYINRLARREIMSGYPCGERQEEPCPGPTSRPYFRPYANATRGQIAKIVANAAQITTDPGEQIYEDVPATDPFYDFINRLSRLAVLGGYPCNPEAASSEPCLPPENRPYFRPRSSVTRGQAAKIVANTFYPNCQTP